MGESIDLSLCVKTLLSLQIVLLGSARAAYGHGVTAVPAAALSLTAAILVLVVSVFEHSRTVKPSALLGVYLLFTILFDAARSCPCREHPDVA